MIDGAFWGEGSPPSARHVTRDLARTWAARHPRDEVVVSAGDEETEPGLDNLSFMPNRHRLLPQAISATMLGDRGLDADAVITHNFASRRRGATRVVILHDVLFIDHPQWFTAAERAYFSMIRPSLRAADIIWTTSETQTARIAALWPETVSRLRRIGLAASRDVVEAVPRPPSDFVPTGPFVLAVGRLNVRKNLGNLVSAFAMVRRQVPSVQLVIVGAPDGRDAHLTEGDDQVRFTGAVSDEELAWFYSSCAVFAFPSMGEGFGLPLLEAAHFGVPVVCSDLPEFTELNIAADLFDPTDTEDIARALVAALENRESAEQGPPARAPIWGEVVDRARMSLEGLTPWV